jgi:hypothetical protein
MALQLEEAFRRERQREHMRRWHQDNKRQAETRGGVSPNEKRTTIEEAFKS